MEKQKFSIFVNNDDILVIINNETNKIHMVFNDDTRDIMLLPFTDKMYSNECVCKYNGVIYKVDSVSITEVITDEDVDYHKFRSKQNSDMMDFSMLEVIEARNLYTIDRIHNGTEFEEIPSIYEDDTLIYTYGVSCIAFNLQTYKFSRVEEDEVLNDKKLRNYFYRNTNNHIVIGKAKVYISNNVAYLVCDDEYINLNTNTKIVNLPSDIDESNSIPLSVLYNVLGN